MSSVDVDEILVKLRMESPDLNQMPSGLVSTVNQSLTVPRKQ
jgi:hypothetical protein